MYFSKALFEGLFFGGAYLRRDICVSKLIGLALWLEINVLFWLCFTLYLRPIFQVQVPGGLIFGGAIQRRVFCVYSLRGLYVEGLIFGILWYFELWIKIWKEPLQIRKKFQARPGIKPWPMQWRCKYSLSLNYFVSRERIKQEV